MQVPGVQRRAGENKREPARRRAGMALALVSLLMASSALAAPKASRQGVPWMQLPLENLGFPGMSAAFVESGASMLTVHFLDETHLLLTYSERSLVPRIADDPDAGVDDRLVSAKVVELPSGRVMARTQWHMHDHGRYLWKLGSGSFLVRIGDQLYTISPLAQLAARQDAFLRSVVPGRGLRPTAIMVSAEGGLLTVETVVRTATSTGQTTVVLGDTDTPLSEQQGTKTLIDFYRLHPDKNGVEVTAAGAINSASPLFIPLDADGLLWAHQTASDAWSITFDSFGGKTFQLGDVQSSCQPRLQMLGASEFLALSCRGGDDRIKMASYGMDGKETWEEQVGDFGVPTFAYAPAAARFAVSHIVAAELPISAGMTGAPARQEVRVYQNASGDQLLKVDCQPVMKSAENFDLSDDGTEVVVVRNGALALYKLPPPSGRDREDMAEVAKFAPPAIKTGMVRLPRLTGPVTAFTAVRTAQVPEVQAPAASAAATSPSPAPARRAPPTFLEPGEKPEFGKPNEPVPPPPDR